MTPPHRSDDARVDHGVILGYQGHDVGLDAGELALGQRARLRTGTVLYAGSRIGDDLSTGHNVVVREGCVIGRGVSVWSNSVIDYGCVVGDRVKVHANCYVAQYSVLEDDVFLAPGVVFANDLYPGDHDSAAVMQGPTIERGAQLGARCVVLPYVRIGRNAIVGAGAVVTRDVPPGAVVRGVPARASGHVDSLRPIAERIDTTPDGRLGRIDVRRIDEVTTR